MAGNMQTLVYSAAGYNALTPQQQRFYQRVLLKGAQPYLLMLEDGQKGTHPRNSDGFSTGSVRWRKRGFLAAATTALTEGVPPNFVDLTFTEITTQLAQYGSGMKHSDILAHAAIDPIVTVFSEALGEQAGLTIHTIIMNTLAGSGTVQYATGVAGRVNLTAAMVLNATEIRKAVRTLKRNKVPTFPDGTYHAVIHTDQAYDLMSDADWRGVNGLNYPGGGGLLTGEVGMLHGVRFRESTEAPVFAGAGAGGVNVFAAFIYGPDAYGVLDFAAWPIPNLDPATGRGIKIMMVPADQPDKVDFLGQYGVLGWKVAFQCYVLDSTRIIRLETGATA